MFHVIAVRTTSHFDVGDHQYHCPSFFAAFLSSLVGNVREVDASLDHCEIKTPDPTKLFPEFMSLASGQSIRLDEHRSEFLSAVACELENIELCYLIFDELERNLTIDNICACVCVGEVFAKAPNEKYHFWPPISFVCRIRCSTALTLRY
jgi:hypothetical protein